MAAIDFTVIFQWYVQSASLPSGTQIKGASHPIHYAWDRFGENVRGHCLNVDRFFIASGSVNAVLNFLIFVLVCLPAVISSRPRLPTDTVTADTALVPSSYVCKATIGFGGSVHLGWLVCSNKRTTFLLPAGGC